MMVGLFVVAAYLSVLPSWQACNRMGCDGRPVQVSHRYNKLRNFHFVEASWFVSFWKGRVTCPYRNEWFSFVSIECGKEVPKFRLGLTLIFSSHRRSSTDDVLPC